MADENFLIQITVGVLSGAIGGWASNFAYDEYKRQKTTDSLMLVAEPADGLHINARVVNRSDFVVKNCWVYISINHQQGDILQSQQAFVGPSSKRPVTDDRLCWSLADNPPNVDILSHEPQRLFIAQLDQAGFWIAFASEKGTKPARIFLRADRDYPVIFKIVSESTKGITYSALIDPRDVVQPIKNLVRL
jgi:hypothetical protein